jgi:hypothetical protein
MPRLSAIDIPTSDQFASPGQLLTTARPGTKKANKSVSTMRTGPPALAVTSTRSEMAIKPDTRSSISAGCASDVYTRQFPLCMS